MGGGIPGRPGQIIANIFLLVVVAMGGGGGGGGDVLELYGIVSGGIVCPDRVLFSLSSRGDGGLLFAVASAVEG